MQVILFVEAPEHVLTAWLERHTLQEAPRVIPTPDGDLYLRALRDLNLFPRQVGPIAMHGFIPPRQRRGKDRDVYNVVAFSIMPLAPSRTELRISTGWPALEAYVAELAAAIRQRWKTSSPGDTRPVAAPAAPARPACAHADEDGICSACAEFLARIGPILTRGDSKPKQEDVARSLGYTTRHLRRLCEGLGYRSWPAFYAAVRAGRLSPMS